MDIIPAETTTIKQDHNTKLFEAMMFEFFQGENSDTEKHLETHRSTPSESRPKLDGFHMKMHKCSLMDLDETDEIEDNDAINTITSENDASLLPSMELLEFDDCHHAVEDWENATRISNSETLQVIDHSWKTDDTVADDVTDWHPRWHQSLNVENDYHHQNHQHVQSQ